jgi:hypothetical protein
MSEETKKDSNVEEQNEIQDEQLEGAGGSAADYSKTAYFESASFDFGVEREVMESGEIVSAEDLTTGNGEIQK